METSIDSEIRKNTTTISTRIETLLPVKKNPEKKMRLSEKSPLHLSETVVEYN